MKKILYIILIFAIVIMIYLKYGNKKYNYVSLSDKINDNNRNYNTNIRDYLIKNNKLKSYNDYFINKSIYGLISDIKDNRTIVNKNKEYYLKKILRESDIIVINIGMERIYNNYDKYDIGKNYYYFSKLYIEIEDLIKEIRKYAKGDIIFIGYYNPTNYYDSKTDELFYDVNNKLNSIMEKYSLIYIDIYEQIKMHEYKRDDKTYLLNTFGERMISDIIECYLK